MLDLAVFHPVAAGSAGIVAGHAIDALPHQFGDQQAGAHFLQQLVQIAGVRGNVQVMYPACVGGTRQAELAAGIGAEDPASQQALLDESLLTRGQTITIEGRATEGAGQIGSLVDRHPGGKDRLPHGVEQEGRLTVDRATGNRANQVPEQTRGLVSSKQYRHPGSLDRAAAKPRQGTLGRLAAKRLGAG